MTEFSLHNDTSLEHVRYKKMFQTNSDNIRLEFLLYSILRPYISVQNNFGGHYRLHINILKLKINKLKTGYSEILAILGIRMTRAEQLSNKSVIKG